MIGGFQITLIFISVIIGVVSAVYLYSTSNIFSDLLKRPLKLISVGMFIIAIGVLLAAFIYYASGRGVELSIYGIPLSVVFYVTYIIGSIFIASGARKFSRKPKPIASLL